MILEDDLEVSPYFYLWLQRAWDRYYCCPDDDDEQRRGPSKAEAEAEAGGGRRRRRRRGRRREAMMIAGVSLQKQVLKATTGDRVEVANGHVPFLCVNMLPRMA